MVKALVMGYIDIIEPVNVTDQNFFLRVNFKFFDNISGIMAPANVDVLIDENDNQSVIDTKVLDAIIETVANHGVTIVKRDVLMIDFKRG